MDETDGAGGVLGYRFRDPTLLETALTHRSYGPRHNERLEFLGDAVLGLATAELLVEATDDDAEEGHLTLARARAVNRAALADAARLLDLGPRLRLGEGERNAGGADKDRVLCGAFEAVVGAVFVDGGYAAARALVAEVLGESLQAPLEKDEIKDPKNLLQELAQGKGLPLPSYELVAQEGEAHAPTFEARVAVGHVAATGSGTSKKQAEREAAARALALAERFPGALGGEGSGPDDEDAEAEAGAAEAADRPHDEPEGGAP